MYWLTRTIAPESGVPLGVLIHADTGVMSNLLDTIKRVLAFSADDSTLISTHYYWRSPLRCFDQHHKITDGLLSCRIVPVEVPPAEETVLPYITEPRLHIHMFSQPSAEVPDNVGVTIKFTTTWENNREFEYRTTVLPLPLIKEAARGIMRPESFLKYDV